MKLKILHIALLTSILLMGGCKKFVEVGPPSNQIASETIFLSEGTATAAINGLYNTMSNTSLSFAGGGQTVYLGLYADEIYTTSTTANVLEFVDGKLSSSNSIVYNNFWRYAYQVIYQSNSCIAGLEKSPLAPDFKQQLLGEAYFVRAYCYWQLVNLFGDIPLVLTADDYASVVQMKRSPIAEVRAQVLTDLAQAKIMLKPEYPTTGRFRVNYYTVMAMISRVQTYIGNWTEVLASSNEVISQSSYSLESDLNKVFLIGSTEAIWQTGSGNPTYGSYEGFAFVPATSATIRPVYPLQASLYNAFSSTDKRKINWIAVKTIAGVTYQYPYKYKIRLNASTTTPKTECQMMVRLGEIYLNRAEAKAHLGDPTAIDDLNKIRNRAGLISLSGLTGQALIDAILKERRLELFAEWGLRWLDLKRTGQLDQVIGPLKNTWTSTASLFPIPTSEILAAPNLTQNPGYN
ncbi:RagB/SusD family nutrient uptake outer membrane protein [Chryseobacterium sp. SIMBA_029]|uniref:RagB/SusD family nutrient uptake outer membrane protein n=3 Tax=Bacteria TaxID=2 RepID=UPI0039791E34